jgi:hypothetical protein
LRVLPEPRFQFGDPRLQGQNPRLLLGVDLQQLLDDNQRLLSRLGAQVRRQRRHTTICTALLPNTPHIFYCAAKSEA